MPVIKNFNDWPVKKKLSFIVLITSGVLIAVMAVAVTVEKTLSYRAKALNSSKVLAAIIGENSTAALSFRDEATAKEILSALKAEKDILEAALYSSNGTIFSQYVHSGHWSTDSTLWFSKIYHQCSPIEVTLGTNCAIRAPMKLTNDFPVIIAF